MGSGGTIGKVEASKDDCAQEKLARHQTLTLHHESQLPTLPLAQWGQIIFEIVFTIFYIIASMIDLLCFHYLLTCKAIIRYVSEDQTSI